MEHKNNRNHIDPNADSYKQNMNLSSMHNEEGNIADSTGHERVDTSDGPEPSSKSLPTLDRIANKDFRGEVPPGEKPPAGGKWFDNLRGKPFPCLVIGTIVSLAVILFIGIGVLTFLTWQYFRIAAGLPSVDDLRARASQFETTRIYDRNGNLIYEILDPNAGRRTYITLDETSPFLVAATIATEDKDFYSNPGFDPFGILRALIQNYTAGETVSGASTITQQLARTLLLTPEERAQRTVQRKTREIVLAAEITRRYSKDEILELYLNEIFYGNLAYGIEAAAETYFGTSADQLTLGQAAFIAGLPQTPAIYDIFTNPEATLSRQKDVLNLMYQLSKEDHCIDVSNSDVPVCVSLNEAVAAAQEIEQYPFKPRPISMPFPHWVYFIRAQLEKQFDAQTIYRSGFRVYTTLDPDLQRFAEQSVKTQVEALADKQATDGALVAIRPNTGEILAMVGSADFYNEAISGQVNMAVAPRQPGSSIKPLTYAAAFEKGWTPATLIWDVPSEFPPSGNPNDPSPPYKPVNYDSKFHGPVLARTALGSSYNVPAVKTLSYVGIYDDPNTPQPDGFINFAQRMGITTFTRSDYGLSLTLGGGDVSLLELTSAYSIFANSGSRVLPSAILRIEDFQGNLIYQYDQPVADQVIRPEHAYLITDILSDNEARTPAFGANSVLRLPFTAAVKTGTTNDFRDNWTLGFTPDMAIGVWVGNADYTPMVNISGIAGAAPIWSEVMQWAIERYAGNRPTPFIQPSGIVDKVICNVSGAEVSEYCPGQKREIFAFDQLPLSKNDDLWQKVKVDTWTNLKASQACSDLAEEKMTLNVKDVWAQKWINESSQGKSWAEKMGLEPPVIFTPDRECRSDDPRPKIEFVGLSDNMTIAQSSLDIYAVVTASANFKAFAMMYGIGANPNSWDIMMDSRVQISQPTKLYSLDVSSLSGSQITLRIYVEGYQGAFAEERLHLNIIVPTMVPSITPTMTETPTPTMTITIAPTSTEILIPTATDTPLPTATDTSIPTITETPTPTVTDTIPPP